MRTYIDIITESSKTKSKINRSAFIYLSPKSPKGNFAQCGSCVHFIPTNERCSILNNTDHVKNDSSCGLYLHGTPSDEQESNSIVTAEQVGLVSGPVRCQNCSWSNNGKCKLFEILNDSQSDIFSLNTSIDPDGCCNAWTSK